MCVCVYRFYTYNNNINVSHVSTMYSFFLVSEHAYTKRKKNFSNCIEKLLGASGRNSNEKLPRPINFVYTPHMRCFGSRVKRRRVGRRRYQKKVPATTSRDERIHPIENDVVSRTLFNLFRDVVRTTISVCTALPRPFSK